MKIECGNFNIQKYLTKGSWINAKTRVPTAASCLILDNKHLNFRKLAERSFYSAVEIPDRYSLRPDNHDVVTDDFGNYRTGFFILLLIHFTSLLTGLVLAANEKVLQRCSTFHFAV